MVVKVQISVEYFLFFSLSIIVIVNWILEA